MPTPGTVGDGERERSQHGSPGRGGRRDPGAGQRPGSQGQAAGREDDRGEEAAGLGVQSAPARPRLHGESGSERGAEVQVASEAGRCGGLKGLCGVGGGGRGPRVWGTREGAEQTGGSAERGQGTRGPGVGRAGGGAAARPGLGPLPRPSDPLPPAGALSVPRPVGGRKGLRGQLGTTRADQVFWGTRLRFCFKRVVLAFDRSRLKFLWVK